MGLTALFEIVPKNHSDPLSTLIDRPPRPDPTASPFDGGRLRWGCKEQKLNYPFTFHRITLSARVPILDFCPRGRFWILDCSIIGLLCLL